jgi:hypothetical protein
MAATSSREQQSARTREPHLRDLNVTEIEALLRRNHIGRLGFIDLDGRVEIVPIHYVFGDGWIYGRTSSGTKIDSLSRNWWVAFEVEEVDGLFDWRSVVVHGGFYGLAADGPNREIERYQEALDALRSLLPSTFAEDDPVPFRTIVFGIAVQEVTGRAASTGSKQD